jgi:arylsulfatase A-like enzyme
MRQLLSLVALLAIAAPVGADTLQRPNVLVLMAEDMSARVAAFGDAVAHTPNLDRLAREGVRYPNTFTTAGVCAPSRAAHITGVHQVAIGAQHMRTSRGPLGTYTSVPPAEVKAYPELLRAAGYYTFTNDKLDYQFSGPMAGTGPFTIWDDEGLDTHWRNRRAGQPFYGLVNYGVTHEGGVFQPLGSWPNSPIHFAIQLMRWWVRPDAPSLPATDPAAVQLPPYFPDTPTVRGDIARHYDNIAVMDWQVGEVLRELEEEGLLESTIVIWTTDHGDGLPRGKRELYDSGIRVPMIIRWPERWRPSGVSPGALETRLVSFVDFAPTILRLASVEAPGYLQGRDFVLDAPRQYVYASRDRIDEVSDRQRAVRDGRYKYIRSWRPEQPGGHHLRFRDNMDMMIELWQLLAAGELNPEQRLWFEAPGEERLFDLASDPWELRDIAADLDHAATLARLRGALLDWQARVEDWSEQSEAAMRAGFWPDGKQPVTAAPRGELLDGRLYLAGTTSGASLGYRVDGGAWRLYTSPVPVRPGSVIEARAVRYGWEESDVVEIPVP